MFYDIINLYGLLLYHRLIMIRIMHTIITITITRTSHLSGNVQCGIEIFAGYLAIGLRHFTEVPVSNHINLIKCVLLLLSSARMSRPLLIILIVHYEWCMTVIVTDNDETKFKNIFMVRAQPWFARQ